MENEQIRVPAEHGSMDGMLRLPEDPLSLIVFVNGGGNRLKPPGDYVAGVLSQARLGILWLDLLTQEESLSRQPRVDANMLSQRLSAACNWLGAEQATSELPIGLFGTGAGAAAALQLAGRQGNRVAAMVTRGGRPDFSTQASLAKIRAPTLMIVGSLDEGVIDQNRAAYAALRCEKRFEVIPGATHLFEEAGTVEVVARMARNWFLRHARHALA